MRKHTAQKVRLLPRLRVLHGDEIALGPGKVELLESIASTGSIRQSAEEMGMSYMRAWKLIKTMNACFNEPLVEAVRGGSAHGGAVLTKTGKRAVKAYRQMETAFLKSAKPQWREMQLLLKP